MLENCYEFKTEKNGKIWEVAVAVKEDQEHFVKMTVGSRCVM